MYMSLLFSPTGRSSEAAPRVEIVAALGQEATADQFRYDYWLSSGGVIVKLWSLLLLIVGIVLGFGRFCVPLPPLMRGRGCVFLHVFSR